MNKMTEDQLKVLHDKLSDLVQECVEVGNKPETLEKHLETILIAADMAEAWIMICELDPDPVNKRTRDFFLKGLMRGAGVA
jgi:uncharacterized Rossmann fold enzyme